jgi:hypothetical protein
MRLDTLHEIAAGDWLMMRLGVQGMLRDEIGFRVVLMKQYAGVMSGLLRRLCGTG